MGGGDTRLIISIRCYQAGVRLHRAGVTLVRRQALVCLHGMRFMSVVAVETVDAFMWACFGDFKGPVHNLNPM